MFAKNNLNTGDVITNAAVDNLDSGIEAAHLGTHIYGASSAGSDTYALTFSPALGSYNTGLIINLKTDVANTGAATLNINSLGAKSIKKISSGVKADIVTGDMSASVIYTMIYDGTDFVLVNPNLKAYEFISETTVGAAAGQVDITVPTGYKCLLLRYYAESDTGEADIYVRFNDDAGNNYTYFATTSASSIHITYAIAPPNAKSFGELRIMNISTETKLVAGHNQRRDSTRNQFEEKRGSWENTTDEITKINVIASANNIAIGSIFTLWGVR